MPQILGWPAIWLSSQIHHVDVTKLFDIRSKWYNKNIYLYSDRYRGLLLILFALVLSEFVSSI